MGSLSRFHLTLALICSSLTFAQKPELIVQMGHQHIVSSVAISADGRHLLTCSYDLTAKLWDISSGKEIRTFLGHSKAVMSVVTSADGRYLLTGGLDKTAKLWDVSSGKEIRTFSGHSALVSTVGITADSRYVVTASWDSTAKLWDISSGEETRTFSGHSARINSVAVSADGRYVVTGSSDHTAKLWDLSSGQEIRTLTGHTSGINSVAISGDGRYVLTGSDDYTAKMWETSSGQQIWTISEYSYSDEAFSFEGIAISADGQYVATASGMTARLWRTTNREQVQTFSGHSNSVNAVAISEDGRYAVTGSDRSTAKLWDLRSGQQVRSFSLHSDQVKIYGVDAVGITADGRHVVTEGWDNTAKLWDVGSGKIIRTFSGHAEGVTSVAISADGRYVVTGSYDGTAKLWEAGSGKEIQTFSGHSLYGHPEGVNSVAISGDARYVVTGSNDRTAKLWDLSSGREIRTFSGHSSHVSSVAISSDGRYVVTGSWDNTAKLWDLGSGKEIRTFSGHSHWVNSVAISSDGQYVVTGSGDGTAKLWDLSSGCEIRTFSGHSSSINSVAISATGRRVVAGGRDAKTIIWNLSTGERLATLVSLDQDDWAVITEDGRFDASPGGMKSMHYAQGLEVLPLESFFEQFYTPGLLAHVLSSGTHPATKTSVDFSQTIKLPPLVRIVSPSQGQSFTSDEVQITAEVTDQGGGIDEIRLYQNGKLISEEQRGVKILPSKEAKLVEKYDVNLVAGLNEFKVTALNMDRTESLPAILTIELKAGESVADLYILSIGINQYKNSRLSLNYGRPDAEAFLEVVEEKARGIFKEIFTYAIYDSDATRAAIELAFARIILGSSAQDGFIFYYAGHGVVSEGDSSAKSDFYLVPTGVTQLYGNDQMLSAEAISATALKEYCRKIPAQKQLIIIDACQAGGAVETFAVRGAVEQKAIAQLARSAGVVVLAATGTEQFATEFRQLGHGVFTYALLEGLQGEADGSPKDGKVTVAELKAYLDDQIPELTKRYRGQAQYPMAYMRGQDFPVGIAK